MSQEDKEISQDVQEVDNQTGNENLEREARVFGWVPKEEFRGSDTDWVDAEVFVKRGKEINPILRKNNELLLKKLDEKGKEIDTKRQRVYRGKPTDLVDTLAKKRGKSTDLVDTLAKKRGKKIAPDPLANLKPRGGNRSSNIKKTRQPKRKNEKGKKTAKRRRKMRKTRSKT